MVSGYFDIFPFRSTLVFAIYKALDLLMAKALNAYGRTYDRCL